MLSLHQGLLELAAGTSAPWRPADADPLTSPDDDELMYPAQVPALGEWVARGGGCAYRIVPEVADALRARSDVVFVSSPDIEATTANAAGAAKSASGTGAESGSPGPAWDALDALFALCGTWTADAAQAATGPARATIVGLIPHLSHVLTTLWQAKPRPSNKLLVQELAMTMYSAAVVEAAASSDMTAGKEWCERALQVWEEARGGKAREDDFWIRASFHLGNQHLLLKNGDEGVPKLVHLVCMLRHSPRCSHGLISLTTRHHTSAILTRFQDYCEDV